MVLDDKRMCEAEIRSTPSHYDGDLTVSAGSRSVVDVLVERPTCYTFLCHLPQHDATSTREVF